LIERPDCLIGWIIRLFKGRDAEAAEFAALLRDVLDRGVRPRAESSRRWQDLLIFVYNARGDAEIKSLEHNILSTAHALNVASEVTQMSMTFAESLMQQGELRGEARGEARGQHTGMLRMARRQLLGLMKQKFITITPDDEDRINREGDCDTLELWTRRILTAQTPADIWSPNPID